jgi:hypothetical protein
MSNISPYREVVLAKKPESLYRIIAIENYKKAYDNFYMKNVWTKETKYIPQRKVKFLFFSFWISMTSEHSSKNSAEEYIMNYKDELEQNKQSKLVKLQKPKVIQEYE